MHIYRTLDSCAEKNNEDLYADIFALQVQRDNLTLSTNSYTSKRRAHREM